MPALRIGQAEILYELRRSSTVRERRITVTPGRVEVMALTTDDEDTIKGFLDRKRQWVFNTVREMERITVGRHAVPRFMTGTKIPYRGRNMPLVVRRSDAERLSITYRNGFIVDLPEWAGTETDVLVASELKHWLKQKARRDVHEIAKVYAKRHGIEPRTIRTTEISGGWGSCGPEGNVLVNWLLVFAPRKVIEYVVVHELAHLRFRSHGSEFWEFLGRLMPGYGEAKAWLQKHQSSLCADFLDT